MLGCFEGYNAAVLAYGQTGSKYNHKKVEKATQWGHML